jgi:UDP-galactopyranose mutase
LPSHTASTDLVCLSHLRWDFVFQRPQHLMTRFAAERRVFFVEEPLESADARIEVQISHGVHVVVPYLPPHLSPAARETTLRHLLHTLFTGWHIARPLLWVYTPMAWPLVSDMEAELVIYDCMDELSGFRGAPPELVARERELFARADVVFTGGHSLYEAKRRAHRFVHPVPSSVDVAHFARARRLADDRADQRALPRPRLGFAGVIDERMNLDLIAAIAVARPEWQIVMIGPTVKIDPATLPRARNIHYLGMRKYDELPAYFAGWDVALLPFALNEATRYISPTKTPEYLAAGLPVVSTSVRDVVRPYGERGVVQIADAPETFIAAIERQLSPDGARSVKAAEGLLAAMSWDRTWAAMAELIEQARDRRSDRLPAAPGTFVFGSVHLPRPATSPS